MSKITINGVSFDPAAQLNGLVPAGLASADAASSNYILVQVKAPLTAPQRAELEKTGCELIEYVPTNTLVCRFEPKDLGPVRALPFVSWANVYLKGFKIAPALLTPEGDMKTYELMSTAPAETSMSQQPRTVDVVLHRDVDANAVREKIASAVGVDLDDVKLSRNKVRLIVRPQAMDKLARLDEVRHLEEVKPVKLHNTVALRIIGADHVHTSSELHGEGQIIAVCDTGFDKGSTTDVHPAFTDRVVRLYALGRTASTDPNGHGTHVAGSVLGNGSSPTMGGAVTGAAPRGKLVLQSVLDSFGGLGGLPDDLNDLFEPVYRDDNARVHTNSWGAPMASEYTSNSREVDEFVWNNRDLVVLFSAGNEGTDANANGVIDNGSIGSPATAKNCITVGATESDRAAISKAYGDAWPNDFPVDPIASDKWADNPGGLAAFSSRGPTKDGRIKPDVVAPGTAILSAHSRKANVGSFWGPSADPLYCFMGGTSMSTPIVAGCAAVVRQFLQRSGTEKPSAALVKAMLINGANDIPGQYTPSDAGAAPNFAEGFGRVDMIATVGPRPEGISVVWQDESAPLDTGESWSTTVDISRAGMTLKATLVWTDPPGESLQNDLDLIVLAPGGVERHGNVAPSSTSFDRKNNVEQVTWRGIPVGAVKVVVRAHRVAVHAQSFAVVLRTEG